MGWCYWPGTTHGKKQRANLSPLPAKCFTKNHNTQGNATQTFTQTAGFFPVQCNHCIKLKCCAKTHYVLLTVRGIFHFQSICALAPVKVSLCRPLHCSLHSPFHSTPLWTVTLFLYNCHCYSGEPVQHAVKMKRKNMHICPDPPEANSFGLLMCNKRQKLEWQNLWTGVH